MKKNNIVAYCVILILLFYLNNIAQDADTALTETEVVDTVAVEEVKIGDVRAGNFSRSVHVIKLFDENGYVIHEEDELLMPFSTGNTCGECHSINTISGGTHFDNLLNEETSGRQSEPFILFDPYTLTVIPLSYKGWPGTFNPKTVGLSPMKFMDLFGSHYTGGIISSDEYLQHPDNFFRWEVSGKLEINCLICHDADPAYDAAEYSSQILKQNYRWAATAASGFAEVKGSAKKMPDNFDPFNTNTYADVDLRTSPPPTVTYDFSKFNSDNKVFFDIERTVPKEKCYYCHSSVTSSVPEEMYLHNKEDVHLKAGMTCVDCHRNDLSHDMVKGYENEWREKRNRSVSAYSCEGCHIGNGNSDSPVNGNFGAPVPAHKGIPSVHFEKMTCTVCHAGSWPDGQTKLVKTSRSHKLGAHFAFKSEDAYPHIQSSVYVNNEYDKLELRNSVWASYWAVKRGEIIQPLDMNFMESQLRSILNLDSILSAGTVPKLNDSLLTLVLTNLNSTGNSEIEIIYVSGDKQVRLTAENKLNITEIDDAEAYTWPIGHTVRPASQSLGVRGCNDCHTFNSSFFFSSIESETFIESTPLMTHSMTKYSGSGVIYNKVFSLSFIFRPLLKFIIIFSCGIITLTVLVFLGRSIHSFSKFAAAGSSSSQNEEEI
jgi:hypothetical protein